MKKLMILMVIVLITCMIIAGCQNTQMEVVENYEQKYIEELRLENKRLGRELEAANSLIEELQNELESYIELSSNIN